MSGRADPQAYYKALLDFKFEAPVPGPKNGSKTPNSSPWAASTNGSRKRSETFNLSKGRRSFSPALEKAKPESLLTAGSPNTSQKPALSPGGPRKSHVGRGTSSIVNTDAKLNQRIGTRRRSVSANPITTTHGSRTSSINSSLGEQSPSNRGSRAPNGTPTKGTRGARYDSPLLPRTLSHVSNASKGTSRSSSPSFPRQASSNSATFKGLIELEELSPSPSQSSPSPQHLKRSHASPHGKRSVSPRVSVNDSVLLPMGIRRREDSKQSASVRSMPSPNAVDDDFFGMPRKAEIQFLNGPTTTSTPTPKSGKRAQVLPIFSDTNTLRKSVEDVRKSASLVEDVEDSTKVPPTSASPAPESSDVSPKSSALSRWKKVKNLVCPQSDPDQVAEAYLAQPEARLPLPKWLFLKFYTAFLERQKPNKRITWQGLMELAAVLQVRSKNTSLTREIHIMEKSHPNGFSFLECVDFFYPFVTILEAEKMVKMWGEHVNFDRRQGLVAKKWWERYSAEWLDETTAIYNMWTDKWTQMLKKKGAINKNLESVPLTRKGLKEVLRIEGVRDTELMIDKAWGAEDTALDLEEFARIMHDGHEDDEDDRNHPHLYFQYSNGEMCTPKVLSPTTYFFSPTDIAGKPVF